jgi:MATE family multidrug resistance protein
MMLGRFSAEALAAGALGNSISIGLSIFAMGVLMALDPLVAQAYGANDHGRVATRFQQGMVVAAVMIVPLTFLMWHGDLLMRITGQDPHITNLATTYLRALIPGNAFFLLFVAMRQTLQAMSLVRPAVVAIVISNLVNIAANDALIFGHYGFPSLGVLGSGWATSISRCVMFLVLLGAAWGHLKPYLIRQSQVWSRRGYRQLLKIGIPSGIHIALELWLFVAVTLMMGNLGTNELAAHQIALNLASLTFMVPLGVSGAAATRVGNAIGRGDMFEARRSATVCLGLGAGVMAIFGLIFWGAPRFLSRLYTTDLEVIAMAAALIPVAAAFQVFDGLQVVAVGSLRGIADTRFPAAVALVGFWLFGLPLGWWLAYTRGLGAPGLWWGLTTGLGSVAILLLIRMRLRFSLPLTALQDHHCEPNEHTPTKE